VDTRWGRRLAPIQPEEDLFRVKERNWFGQMTVRRDKCPVSRACFPCASQSAFLGSTAISSWYQVFDFTSGCARTRTLDPLIKSHRAYSHEGSRRFGPRVRLRPLGGHETRVGDVPTAELRPGEACFAPMLDVQGCGTSPPEAEVGSTWLGYLIFNPHSRHQL
jgi:hypothetical protein